MKRAKTARGRRILKNKEAKAVETEPKKALFLRGGKSSKIGQSVLRDFGRLKAPDGHALSRKNEDVRLFEETGEAKLEHLMRKFDCSLFAYTSHNKKRPNNLILGRTFDGSILDVMEFGVLDYKGIGGCTLVSRRRTIENALGSLVHVRTNTHNAVSQTRSLGPNLCSRQSPALSSRVPSSMTMSATERSSL